ncbi:MAG: heavy-metal-associated domain-containing protein, partial [bacterium]
VMTQTTLTIDGMHCGGCVANVKRALERIDGVTTESVRVGEARIAYDERQTPLHTILGSVAEAGYPARVSAGAE